MRKQGPVVFKSRSNPDRNILLRSGFMSVSVCLCLSVCLSVCLLVYVVSMSALGNVKLNLNELKLSLKKFH